MAADAAGSLEALRCATRALKELADLKKLEIRSRHARGELIERDVVAVTVFAPIDQAFRRLVSEMPEAKPSDLLTALSDMAQTIAEATQTSKEKDDSRGARVIADYAEAHAPASEDGFVKETWEATKELQSEIQDLLGKL